MLYNVSLRSMNGTSGQLLMEILLAIAILMGIAALVAGLISSSSQSSEFAQSELVATRLAEEAMETLRTVSQSNDTSSQGWNLLYLPPDGSGDPITGKGSGNPYHVIQSGAKWILIAGEETITLSNKHFQRKIIVENVSRDPATATIESSYNASHDDPTTQKVTVIVIPPSSLPIQIVSYFSRYLNTGSLQTNWNGGTGSGPFAATSTMTKISGSQNADISNGNCGGNGPCVRLQPQ